MPSNAETKLDWPKLLETALTVPGHVGNTYNRFYEYSFLNQMLLMMQDVFEPVATYKRWQTLGRQVVRGAKAHMVIRPLIYEKKDENGEKTGERFVRFTDSRSVFGYSQTEGEELPEVKVPHWDLGTALETFKVTQVPFKSPDGNTQGYSLGREFAINPMAANPLKTTFHELGHIVLGHTTETGMAEYQTHRGLMEFQAEGTALLVGKELDVLSEQQVSESRGYVQGWTRGQRPGDEAIRQVFAATNEILKAGRLAVTEAVEAA